MNIVIKNYSFKPKLIPSLVALIFFCLFVSLGFWQLDRAEYKRALHAEFVKKTKVKPVSLQEIISDYADNDTYLWRQVIAKGSFNKNVHILLDNQVIKGQAGYFVYSPMKINAQDKWALVNRGWLPAGNDRSKVPEIENPASSVTINAVIKKLPKTGVLLKESVPEKINEDIIRVQKVEREQLEQLLGIDLLPFILRLEPDSEFGFVREWSVPGSGEEMHLGYAFQWFAFATTLFIIFIIVSFKKVNIVENGSK